MQKFLEVFRTFRTFLFEEQIDLNLFYSFSSSDLFVKSLRRTQARSGGWQLAIRGVGRASRISFTFQKHKSSLIVELQEELLELGAGDSRNSFKFLQF